MKKNNQQRNVTSQSKRLQRLHILMFFLGATLCLLLVPTTVSSLGVAPSSYNIDYEEGVIDLQLRVMNTEAEELFATFVLDGELADYVVLSEDAVLMEPGEESRTIPYSINLPSDLEPGPHEVRIKVIEDTLGNDPHSGTSVQVGLSVVQRVTIMVPYPGQFLSGELFVEGTQTNAPITFVTHVVNKGKESILAEGELEIKGPTNEVVSTMSIPETFIDGISKKKINTVSQGLENPGVYRAESTLKYNGEQTVFRKTFVIGEAIVDLLQISVDEFTLGDIAKLSLVLKSRWNKEIDNVYAEITVFDDSGNKVNTFKTIPVSVPPDTPLGVEAYWETKNLPIGSYNVAVVLHYEGKSTTNNIQAIVNADSIKFIGDGISGYATSGTSGSGGLASTYLVIFIVFGILLVGMNVFWIRIFIKKSKK